jgi:hypothetical protein
VNTSGFVRLLVSEGRPEEPTASVRVEEEDSFTVLSAPPDIPETGPHPIRVMTEAWQAEPHAIPSLRKHGRSWLLILHDLESEPSTTEAVLRQGLELLFAEAEREGVESLDIPLLGAVHSVIPATRAAELLQEVLLGRWFHRLKTVRVRGGPFPPPKALQTDAPEEP